MIDKIIRVNKCQAYIIYQDGRVISLYSSTNVDELILIVLLPRTYDGDLGSYCRSLDDTVSINKKVV